jgi:hypothetical protein
VKDLSQAGSITLVGLCGLTSVGEFPRRLRG